VDILPPRRENRPHIVTLETGEWLQYTATSETSKNYRVSLLLSTAAPGKIVLELNGKLHELPIPDTRGTWQMVHQDALPFREGMNVMRVRALGGEVGIQVLQFR
jgi:hypothetical protein